MQLSEDKQKEYLEHPSRCPVCNSGELEGGSYQGDGNHIFQNIHCLNCGALWDDVYTLTGIDDVKTKEEQ